jgi:hypothetical protein
VDHEALLALGWMLWYQHLAVEGDHDRLAMAVQSLAPCFYAGVGPLPEPLLPMLADAVTGAVLFVVSTSG